MVTVLHNNRCSKSREAIAFLETKGLNFEVKYYLGNPLSERKINDLLEKLDASVNDIIRKNEPLWKDKFSQKSYSRNGLISILANHPKLLQRPIVIKDSKAVIARPAENIEILDFI